MCQKFALPQGRRCVVGGSERAAWLELVFIPTGTPALDSSHWIRSLGQHSITHHVELSPKIGICRGYGYSHMWGWVCSFLNAIATWCMCAINWKERAITNKSRCGKHPWLSCDRILITRINTYFANLKQRVSWEFWPSNNKALFQGSNSWKAVDFVGKSREHY